jgi:hypothetical protein
MNPKNPSPLDADTRGGRRMAFSSGTKLDALLFLMWILDMDVENFL